MNITRGVRPRELNKNYELIQRAKKVFKYIHLGTVEEEAAYEKKNSTGDERKMDSLVNYIEQYGWSNNLKPDFVTTKQLLAALCVPHGRGDAKDFEVHAVRLYGVKFLLKVNEDKPKNPLAGAMFEHYFTRTADTEPLDQSGGLRKVVFNAMVPRGNGGKWNIFYSGQIDARDPDNKNVRLYELKTNKKELGDWFWESRSCLFFWQCFFGKSYEIIIGKYTGPRVKGGKRRNLKKNSQENVRTEYSYSVYEVVRMEPSELVYQKKVNNLARNPKNRNWSIKKGVDLLKDFLHQVDEKLTKDGMSLVLEKKGSEDKWTIKEDEEQTRDFREFLENKLGSS